MIQTDICVLGAGPGGVAAALKLAKLGIPCTLIDKAIFPRDKICGDAISGKVVYAFNRIDKDIFKNFQENNTIKKDCWGVQFTYPNEKVIEIMLEKSLTAEELSNQTAPGFISKRIDFDNYLIGFVKKEPLIDFREGVHITDIKKNDKGFLLKNKSGDIQIQTKLVLAADGAYSKFAREFGGIKKENKHYAGAVRAYYKNVKSEESFNHIELHYVKEFPSGYLWIFPLPNGEANVGAGMTTHNIKKTNTNLTTELIKILKENPRFKDRFAEAELTGKIVGYGLPSGSKKRKISGENYMLIGDAAALIDPLTGEGIGNASISGWFAALQAQKCVEANDFSMDFMKSYDKKIYDKLWKELKISYDLQRISQRPWLVNIIASVLHKNKQFIEILSSMFTDVDLRKKMRNPLFYIRLLFNK